ncbi:MAG: hypothetical protein ACE5JZ_10675 [Kiloniellales bacterium]
MAATIRRTGRREQAMGEETRRAAMLRRHRTLLSRLNRIVARLSRRLEHELTDNAPDAQGSAAGPSPVQTLDALIRAAAKLIPLERQAFGLEDAGGEGDDAGDSLTDAERAHRIVALLERAGAVRVGPAVDGRDSVDPVGADPGAPGRSLS